jgi:hypothetical protein
LAYPGDGHTIETMGGTVYDTDSGGHLVSVTATAHSATGGPDTTTVTTYSAWDSQGRPIVGTDSGGQHFTLTYLGSGDTVMTVGDTVYTSNRFGQLTSVTVTHQPTSPGGSVTTSTTTYSAWDSQNRPIAGSGPDGDFTITYDPVTRNETITFTSGASKNNIVVLTSDGKLISTTLADKTFIDWKIQLELLYNAVLAMPGLQEAIDEGVSGVFGQLDQVKQYWSAPARAGFDSVVTQFTVASQGLQTLLSESVDRMKKTYLNIVDAETINAQGMPTTFGTTPISP